MSNPYMKFFPETVALSLYGDGTPMTPQELHRRYASKNILGAISTDAVDVPSYAIKAAQWEVEDFTKNSSNEPVIYEETKYYTSSTTEVLEYYPYKTHIMENSLNLQGAQLTGDCTTWMVRLMLDNNRLERMSSGEMEQFFKRCSTVPYYADRGHNGEGSNPTRQVNLATKVGYIFEQPYGNIDLTDYKSSYRLGMSWGKSSVPKIITDISSANRPSKALLIKSLSGLLDAQRKRYSIGLGSSMAVASVGNPISVFKGSWNHAMAHTGHDQTDWCVSTFNGPVTFIDQSWGNWNTVTNIPDKWKPWGQGMFAVLTKNLTPFIERGECLCYVPADSGGLPAPTPTPIFL